MAPRRRSIIDGGDRLRGEHGALEVEREDLVEALLGDLGDAEPGDQRAGVVDEDVDRPELGRRALHERANVLGAPHVGRDGDRRAAGRHDPVARLFGALPVAMVAERDVGAEIRERDRGRRADARRCAGHERDAAGEVEIGCHDGNSNP